MKHPTALWQALIGLALLAGTPDTSAQDLRLATTTSTENSGLLTVILPKFEAKSQVKVKVIAVEEGSLLRVERA